jgi:hypothetical protein
LSGRYNFIVYYRRILLAMAALVAMILASMPGDAAAVPISGTFSGTAASGWLRVSEREYIDLSGETVTGSFRIDPALIPDTPLTVSPDGRSASIQHYLPEDASPYMTLSLTVHDAETYFETGQEGNTLYLESDSGGQEVIFGLTALFPYHNAFFTLTGPAGSLFDPFNPQTLRVDANTVLESISFFASRDFGGEVNNLNVQFDEVAAAVPEPSALGLLGVGLAVLVGLGARPRRANRLWTRRAIQ